MSLEDVHTSGSHITINLGYSDTLDGGWTDRVGGFTSVAFDSLVFIGFHTETFSACAFCKR